MISIIAASVGCGISSVWHTALLKVGVPFFGRFTTVITNAACQREGWNFITFQDFSVSIQVVAINVTATIITQELFVFTAPFITGKVSRVISDDLESWIIVVISITCN